MAGRGLSKPPKLLAAQDAPSPFSQQSSLAISAIRQALLVWFRSGHRDLPWRKERDPYSVWVSEIMLQQTRTETGKGYFSRFMARFPTVRALAAHPGYSATELQSHTGPTLSGRLLKVANRLATDADFGARQTLFAASQDLPGDTFIGPRLGSIGPSGPTVRSPLARDRNTARGLWELSEQLTGTSFGV